MILDLRIPLGLMFTLTGLILAIYGLVTNHDAALYSKSMGINVNLWWGVVMLIFGLTMYILGRRKQKQLAKLSASSVQESTQPTRSIH
jgi:uncharacterized membrane protein